MRRFLTITLLLLAIGATFLAIQRGTGEPRSEDQVVASSRAAPQPSLPIKIKPNRPACSQPLGFRIGQVDQGFPINRDDFESAAKAAAAEWQDATGRDWFAFRNDGAITVNLLFDGRQESLDRQNKAQAEIVRALEKLRDRRSETSAAQGQLDASLGDWRAVQSDLQVRLLDYQSQIRELVEGGAADPNRTAELERQRENLLRVAQTIEESRRNFLDKIEQQAEQGEAINREAATLSREIQKLRSSAPAEPFVGGQHIQGGPINEINIYTYQSPEELHFALLHELGHAIGLSHSEKSGAVMNPLRQIGVGDFHLGAADVTAALALCPEQP